MSRSRRKTPIVGYSTARSEADDKRLWHKRWRARERDQLAGLGPDSGPLPVHRQEVSSTWGMAKDGKHWFAPRRQRALAESIATRRSKCVLRLDFSWSGFDENDPVNGRGWLMAIGEQAEGRIFIHLGDESGFTAERVEWVIGSVCSSFLRRKVGRGGILWPLLADPNQFDLFDEIDMFDIRMPTFRHHSLFLDAGRRPLVINTTILTLAVFVLYICIHLSLPLLGKLDLRPRTHYA